jgi:Phytanoyl-CoA dioxygenase (PhyH)
LLRLGFVQNDCYEHCNLGDKLDNQKLLNKDLKADFLQNGMLVIKQFYDVSKVILPIQSSIYEIVGMVIKRHRLSIDRQPFNGGNFDEGYADLIAANRQYGGEVYDLVKQIPAFLRLISSARGEELFCEFRETDLAGIGANSYGIRIDNPFEELYRSHWHQEFVFQPQSMDGLVLWTPLMPISPELGPVVVCLKSHKDGLCRYIKSESYSRKSGAYKIGILNDEKVTARYQHAAPLTEPGDLIIMDFLTIHQSGFNVSNRARWSIQSRFFNFHEPTGMKIGWKASVTAGTDIEEIFSEYFVEEEK